MAGNFRRVNLYDFWESVFNEAGIISSGRRCGIVKGEEGNVRVIYLGIEHITGEKDGKYYLHNIGKETRMGTIREVVGDFEIFRKGLNKQIGRHNRPAYRQMKEDREERMKKFLDKRKKF